MADSDSTPIAERRIILRGEAKARGLKTYFNGKPCPKGHIAERRTGTGHCVTCHLEGKARYRAEHKQEISEYNRAYASANANEIAAYRKEYHLEYYEKNREFVLANNAAWKEANSERMSEYLRSRYKESCETIKLRVREYQIANPEKVRNRKRKWHIENRHRSRANVTQYRAKKLQATPSWAIKEEISEFYFAADLLGMVTGEWYHVDHIVPLRSDSVCGLHNQFNLQVMPAIANISKGNRWWPDMP